MSDWIIDGIYWTGLATLTTLALLFGVWYAKKRS